MCHTASSSASLSVQLDSGLIDVADKRYVQQQQQLTLPLCVSVCVWDSCISTGITIPISITTIAAVSVWHATAALPPAWQLAQLKAAMRERKRRRGRGRKVEGERETLPGTDSIEAGQLDCCISIAA